MKKGTVYSIDQIRQFCRSEGFSIEQFGNVQIGEFFTVMKNNDGITASFVFVVSRPSMTFWECIYSEL